MQRVWCGESTQVSYIDGQRESDYIRNVPVRKIQVGQVWKKEGSADSFLITKIYSEALATYAVLRKAGSETEPPIRIKVTQLRRDANPCRLYVRPGIRQLLAFQRHITRSGPAF